MGNRPQGSNKFYMTMVYFWVGIMVYLIFASIFITVKSIQIETADHHFAISDLFHNQLFFTLIVSLTSTYVLWFVVSFLFFDPWHLFTSVSPISPNIIGQKPTLMFHGSLFNTFFSHQPTSTSSMSTHSVTPTISPGVLEAMTKPPNSKAPTLSPVAKLTSSYLPMTATLTRSTKRKCA